ncbi:enoyl-CoA hydratase/isomerase family protein [Natronomonas sp. F2-12]|jgi:enoyl-CoA hydratase/carnithine racemase|uniref:Enoyl-CoA hydratase/isomerase family protein n=1 Tax=Natronomonas aquatica TaxID=2841590 RepID=A0A9R1D7M7_9EURY|nr:enoyl-CoA hydratase/isomerase family protein [Natronomonas aquatica]MCQ4333655.1 enoyl-CoA hydratase/isomerase family protein [Natronomonas aquatica]
MDTTFETTRVEFDDSTGVGRITLDRPDALNALNARLREDIVGSLRALDELNDDGIDMRVVVIEGAQGHFCAGADITEFEADAPTADVDRTHYRFIRDYPVPVVAKIRGYCLGGGLETAMSCDFRFASAEATLGLPEVDLGILPGAGGVQFISRLANPSVAMEIAMTGEHISADRAAEVGIVNHVYPEAELDDAVGEFAETIAAKPPLSIQAIKQSANYATEAGLEAGIEYDRTLIEPLFGTDDHEEGVRAFSEDDYEPEFHGR